VLNTLNRFLLVLNYKLIQKITLNYLFNHEEKKRRKITIPVSYVSLRVLSVQINKTKYHLKIDICYEMWYGN